MAEMKIVSPSHTPGKTINLHHLAPPSVKFAARGGTLQKHGLFRILSVILREKDCLPPNQANRDPTDTSTPGSGRADIIERCDDKTGERLFEGGFDDGGEFAEYDGIWRFDLQRMRC